ncbi:MAG: type II secretion system F family protein [Patescibacteria group bacterium]|nr:type II secretion system F family protein [Patescibacteria group bacterium]
MKTFLYKAKNSRGEIITGTVKAINEIEAEGILVKHNLIALDIASEKSKPLSINFHRKASARDKAVFARQLSTMISAGLPLAKAIKVTSSQAANPQLKTVYQSIYKDLEEGMSFSNALARHPQVFDKVFVSIVNAGENTGKLDVVLKQLADQLENDNNFIGKVRGAMYYPAFILIALVGIASYMLIVVIPQLKSIFDQAGAKLPIATRMLLAMSDFVRTKWWLVLVILIFLAVVFKYWSSSSSGKKAKDRLQLKIPGVSKLFDGIYMYRFSKIMSMLIGAGVPLLDALKIGGSVMNNSLYEASITKAASQVEKGVPLSIQLSKDPVFPPFLGQMVAVGEETGQLDGVLGRVADYYEEATEQAIKTISTLVEPAVLILMGIGVAFLVFAVLVPIYNIAQLQ